MTTRVNLSDIAPSTARCPECGRVFDLMNEDDAAEFYYGHDCEAPTIGEPAFAGIDLDATDEITDWTVRYAARNTNGIAWIDEVAVYACEDTVEECARDEIHSGGGPAIVDVILVDFIRHNPNEQGDEA